MVPAGVVHSSSRLVCEGAQGAVGRANSPAKDVDHVLEDIVCRVVAHVVSASSDRPILNSKLSSNTAMPCVIKVNYMGRVCVFTRHDGYHGDNQLLRQGVVSIWLNHRIHEYLADHHSQPWVG